MCKVDMVVTVFKGRHDGDSMCKVDMVVTVCVR